MHIQKKRSHLHAVDGLFVGECEIRFTPHVELAAGNQNHARRALVTGLTADEKGEQSGNCRCSEKTNSAAIPSAHG
jgi:hypothetical protein